MNENTTDKEYNLIPLYAKNISKFLGGILLALNLLVFLSFNGDFETNIIKLLAFNITLNICMYIAFILFEKRLLDDDILTSHKMYSKDLVFIFANLELLYAKNNISLIFIPFIGVLNFVSNYTKLVLHIENIKKEIDDAIKDRPLLFDNLTVEEAYLVIDFINLQDNLDVNSRDFNKITNKLIDALNSKVNNGVIIGATHEVIENISTCIDIKTSYVKDKKVYEHIKSLLLGYYEFLEKATAHANEAVENRKSSDLESTTNLMKSISLDIDNKSNIF